MGGLRERLFDGAVHRNVSGWPAFDRDPPVARLRATPAAGTSLAR
ncbi:hypothetical protein [Burkholderia sp. HI2714]|nr:hypothetical protein [Burkholderia sp. HI2714]